MGETIRRRSPSIETRDRVQVTIQDLANRHGGLYVGRYSILLFIVGSSASERLAKFNKRWQNRVGKQKKRKKKSFSSQLCSPAIDRYIFPDELLGVCVRLLCYYFGRNDYCCRPWIMRWWTFDLWINASHTTCNTHTQNIHVSRQKNNNKIKGKIFCIGSVRELPKVN
jgi:hypothetical protein